MPVIPTAHTAQRDFFFFTKLFNGQSQRAFLICDTKLIQLNITISGGFSHHIFSSFEGNFSQFPSLGEGKMLFVCVCAGQQRKATDLANGPL